MTTVVEVEERKVWSSTKFLYMCVHVCVCASDLLRSSSDGIEVSYNACGVLAHMVADGEQAWTIQSPTRAYVHVMMLAAIRCWNLKTRRHINYRYARNRSCLAG